MSVPYRLHPLAIRFEPTLTRATVWISNPEVRSAKSPHPSNDVEFGNNIKPDYRDEREIKISTTKALGKLYGAEMACACIGIGKI
jgi:hypothetical protein